MNCVFKVEGSVYSIDIQYTKLVDASYVFSVSHQSVSSSCAVV